MNSVWSETVEFPKFHSLNGNHKTHVLIVGGGMAGVLCAHFLEKNGVDYVLVEGKRIGSGITKNTTAKITSQHGLIYHKLMKGVGLEQAKLYLAANEDALQEYAKLCGEMECDFERKTSYVYSRDNERKLEQEVGVLYKMGCNPKIASTCEIPIETVGAVGFAHQAQFHPLKFMAQLAKGLNIYENTFVKEFVGNKAVTNHGEIKFQNVIFATHFPIDNKHGLYFLKMYQHRSYVLALKGAANYNGMYVDEAMNGMSFRNYKDMLLLGGGDHRTGKRGGNWKELRAFANHYYPYADEEYHWATQDCMTLDEMPYIGQYSRSTHNAFVATGFNKWGMTSSMVAAKLLCDKILAKENPYEEIYNPSRSMLKPQLLINGGEALLNWLTVTEKRCPHLGCALKWNPVEHSWDCPCHGSRFDESGKVLDNPANGDKR